MINRMNDDRVPNGHLLTLWSYILTRA